MLFVELLVCGEPSTSLLEKDVKSTTYSVGRRSLFCRGLGSGAGPKGKWRHLRSRGPWNQQPDLVQAPCSDSRHLILTLWSFSTVTGGLQWISMMNFMESFSCKQDKSHVPNTWCKAVSRKTGIRAMPARVKLNSRAWELFASPCAFLPLCYCFIRVMTA